MFKEDMRKRQLFLDCDGVLADFDAYATNLFNVQVRVANWDIHIKDFWEVIHQDKGGFYRNLPLMPDAKKLYEAVKHVDPIILTGLPKYKIEDNWATLDKTAWAAEHFPGVPIITCLSEEKKLHMQPGDILVDDMARFSHLWEEAGGIFVLHTDADSSINKLKELGVL